MTDTLRTFLGAYHSGTAANAYMFLGCHPEVQNGVDGFVFRVWAPKAQSVSVVGDFNFWNPQDLPMRKVSPGVWEAWSANAREGGAYKYLVQHWNGRTVYKADPVGFRTCRAPDTSSIISRYDRFCWHDRAWMTYTRKRSPLRSPVNIYELHLGSWRRKEDGSLYSYSELAPILAEYVKSMGYTHVEFMPIMEYPYGPSWGYQVTGYYAPTSRYGSPEELMELIDTLHQAGIGVILDWIGVCFTKDEYGLYEFDGTCTYELSDPACNEHPDWGSRLFDLGRPEVRSFLISNAVYWLEVFHFDGIRVAAVDAMLYLDYHRTSFKPNRYGGRENLDAISFLRQLNKACFAAHPNVLMTAEEPTDYPLVTKPDFDGGLGFLCKWDAGWTRDFLAYMKADPAQRLLDCAGLTHPSTYAYAENFILPLSHDTVVHGQGSLINKMPGEYEAKFAQLRLLRGFQMVHPGKKLCFMGGEFAQFTEWDFQKGLDWMLLDFDMHRKMLAYTRALNHFYLEHDQLWICDTEPAGFQWITSGDKQDGILALRRMDKKKRALLTVCNFSSCAQEACRIGVSVPGTYACVFSSDEVRFGGSGCINPPAVSGAVACHGQPDSILLQVPPLSISIFARMPDRSGSDYPQ